jgi:hypothetical protein
MIKMACKFFLLFFVIAFSSCSISSYMVRQNVNPTAGSIKPEPGKSALVISRTTSFGLAIEFTTYLDKKFIGSTKGKSYFAKTDIEPGVKYVSSWAENGEAVKVDFKPDTTYFLQQNVTMGFWRARIVMEAVNAKRLDSGDLEGCAYYLFDQKQALEDLTDAEYKDVISGAQVLAVTPNGEPELVPGK